MCSTWPCRHKVADGNGEQVFQSLVIDRRDEFTTDRAFAQYVGQIKDRLHKVERQLADDKTVRSISLAWGVVLS